MSKKTNKHSQCMNPLFLSWLEGWRDDAKEKGLNAHWTYEKAIRSLKKYPLPLRSGKDAQILENIGDGIAKKLDKELDEFIRNGGDISVMHALPANQTPSYAPVNKDHPKAEKKKTQTKSSDSRITKLDGQEPETKKQKREYMPKQRTGPYALLLTMYRESQELTYRGYLLKEELQHKAESLVEKSFAVAEPGTHYTPWSSMSTLIAKGLISKSSNPAKYSITDEGILLGRKLEETEKANPSFKVPIISSFSLDQTFQGDSSIPSKSKPIDVRPSSSLLKTADTAQDSSNAGVNVNNTETLYYWYIEESGRLSNRKDNALVQVEDNEVWFLIKCEEKCLQRCGVLYRIDTSRPKEDRFTFAFLADKDAKNISVPPNQIPVNQPLPGVNKSANTVNVARHQEPKVTTIQDNHSNTAADAVTPLYTMLPGTFEIVLCVDQMEVAGGANTNSKRMMLEQLKRINVAMDVRKLQLGDFLWIAREKSSLSGTRREVVLDFVVERKRMDDLAGSIVDGRFKEQKFRLKACGLKHPIYLIENYGSIQHMVLPEATLKQAIVNSQIVDGLFIRNTDSIHDSAAYLSRMTQHLQKIYQRKKIMAFPSDHIKSIKQDQNFRDIIREDIQKFMSFDDFYKTTSKNKMLSVREMFAKQLMQLKGISADKAASIVEVYQTPRSLMTAYGQCSTDAERDNLLSDLTYSKTKRKIGPMLATQIRILYTSRTPLT